MQQDIQEKNTLQQSFIHQTCIYIYIYIHILQMCTCQPRLLKIKTSWFIYCNSFGTLCCTEGGWKRVAFEVSSFMLFLTLEVSPYLPVGSRKLRGGSCHAPQRTCSRIRQNSQVAAKVFSSSALCMKASALWSFSAPCRCGRYFGKQCSASLHMLLIWSKGPATQPWCTHWCCEIA